MPPTSALRKFRQERKSHPSFTSKHTFHSHMLILDAIHECQGVILHHVFGLIFEFSEETRLVCEKPERLNSLLEHDALFSLPS